jgi:hypothetical protein
MELMRHRILAFRWHISLAPHNVMRHRNFYICAIEYLYINSKKCVSETEISFLKLKNGGGGIDTESETTTYY